MSCIRVIKLNEKNYSSWDIFVDQSPQGEIFCYTWWLAAVTKSHFEIIVALEHDEIVAGIALPYDDQGKVNQPYLTRSLGVLYKSQQNITYHKQHSNERNWLKAILEHLDMENFVQMCMHYKNSDWLPFRWKGFCQTTRYTYIINYADIKSDDIKSILNRGRKSVLNHAINKNIKVEESEDLKSVHSLCCSSYKRQHLRFNILYDDLLNLDIAVRKNSNRLILKALDGENRIHAIIYLVYTKKSAYYLLSGSNPNYRKSGAHTLVLWESLKYFRNRTEFFNFCGSDIQLIEEHLRGFGGILTPYFLIYNESLFKKLSIKGHLKEIKIHAEGIIKILKSRIAI
jgi:hypothetical protein